MNRRFIGISLAVTAFSALFLGGASADEGISPEPARIEISLDERVQTFEDRFEALFPQGITANSYVVIDIKTGATVFSHNPNDTQNPASITKLMTAIILLESGEDLDQSITITADDIGTEPVNMDLLEGEEISLRNVFEGMLITSGNDAANTISRFVAGSTPDFVAMMNQKATEMGLLDTHFENPIGFDGEFQYSSAADVARLSWYAMQFPEIREAVATRWKTVTSTDGKITHILSSTNILLREDDIIGTKTGRTEDAGECVSIYALGDDYEYIIVVLGSEDRFYDASELLSHAKTQMISVETAYPTASVDVLAPLFGTEIVELSEGESEMISLPDFDLIFWSN
jgi:serine-type D-Ala-D-Ala carboxypeptidase (penicillin-binding protein 5/6)